MAAYWITLRRKKAERLGFSTKTPQQTLAAIARMRCEGWDEVRIIDPHGEETTEDAIAPATADSEVEVEAAS